MCTNFNASIHVYILIALVVILYLCETLNSDIESSALHSLLAPPLYFTHLSPGQWDQK